LSGKDKVWALRIEGEARDTKSAPDKKTSCKIQSSVGTKTVLRLKEKISPAKTLGTRAGALLGAQKKSRLGSTVAARPNQEPHRDARAQTKHPDLVKSNEIPRSDFYEI
jgi:hypothetical protein